jgi:hypothetical protein
MRAIVWDIILHLFGCAIAEAVSRWLPTAAAGCGKWNLWWTLWQVFSKYFGFPFQNHSFHELHHKHIREK